MAYKDGEEFTTYCDKDYDRHNYTIVFKDGRSCDFESYELAKYYWYQWRAEVETLMVKDIKKRSAGKGF